MIQCTKWREQPEQRVFFKSKDWQNFPHVPHPTQSGHTGLHDKWYWTQGWIRQGTWCVCSNVMWHEAILVSGSISEQLKARSIFTYLFTTNRVAGSTVVFLGQLWTWFWLKWRFVLIILHSSLCCTVWVSHGFWVFFSQGFSVKLFFPFFSQKIPN